MDKLEKVVISTSGNKIGVAVGSGVLVAVGSSVNVGGTGDGVNVDGTDVGTGVGVGAHPLSKTASIVSKQTNKYDFFITLLLQIV